MGFDELYVALGGLCLGLYGGTLGQGTGVLGLPLLVDLLGYEFKLARAVCLLGNVPLSGSAVVRHRKEGRSFEGLAPVVGGVILGVAGGVIGRDHLVERQLWIVYATFLTIVFVSFFLRRKLKDSGKPENKFGAFVVGLIGGLFCGSIGVGGGAIMVPGLVILANIPLKRCMILSSTTIIVGSIVSLSQSWYTGTLNLFLLMVPGLVTGAWIGANIGQKLKEKTIRNIFVAVILTVLIKVLIKILDPEWINSFSWDKLF